MGLIKIMTGDVSFVIIKNNPKIYLAQPETDIIEVLTGYGYKYLPEERTGAMLVFEKNGKCYRVHYSVNKYFSKWIFE